jgi:hypothetical protein
VRQNARALEDHLLRRLTDLATHLTILIEDLQRLLLETLPQGLRSHSPVLTGHSAHPVDCPFQIDRRGTRDFQCAGVLIESFAKRLRRIIPVGCQRCYQSERSGNPQRRGTTDSQVLYRLDHLGDSPDLDFDLLDRQEGLVDHPDVASLPGDCLHRHDSLPGLNKRSA